MSSIALSLLVHWLSPLVILFPSPFILSSFSSPLPAIAEHLRLLGPRVRVLLSLSLRLPLNSSLPSLSLLTATSLWYSA